MATKTLKKVFSWLDSSKRASFFYASLCVFLFTIPFEVRFSNIGLILLTASFLLCWDWASAKKMTSTILWRLLFLNWVWLLIGAAFVEKGLLLEQLDNIGKFTLMVVIPILISPAFRIPKKQHRFLFLIFALAVTFGMILNFSIALFGVHPSNHNPFEYAKFVMGMGDVHPAYISMFVVFSFFVALEFLVTSKNAGQKLFYTLLSVFLLCSVFVLYARMPMIALVLILIIYLLQKTATKKSLRLAVSITGIALLSLLLFLLVLPENQKVMIQERLLDNIVLNLSVRIEIWQCAWEVFKANSWLFGVGIGKVQPLLNECYLHRFLTRPFFLEYNSHNDFLMILLRGGVIGFISWTALLVHSIVSGVKEKNVLMIVFVLLFVICGLTEVYLNRIWGNLYFGAIFALIITAIKKNPKSID